MGKSTSSYFPVHAHSQFSTLDGMSKVPAMVARVAEMGQPGMALSDHGNMAGTVQLYKACKQHGIKAFPGIEAYLLDPAFEGLLDESGTAGRFHFGLLALSEKGYKALVDFTSKTHTRPRFSRFPRATLSDITALGRDYGDHVALTTGCHFGWLQQTLIKHGPDAADRVLNMYTQAFPNTFVELHQHNIDDHDSHDEEEELHYTSDYDVMMELYKMAKAYDLPVVAGQDNHYTFQKEKRAHSLMKSMTYGGTDDAFPGDTFHLASADWMEEHFPAKVWKRIEAGHEQLLDLHRLKIKPLDTYKIDVPHIIDNPEKVVWDTAQANLRKHLKRDSANQAAQKKYEDRLAFEWDIIAYLGMAVYFAIWMEFVKWCKQQHIAIEARGSANGSLIAYVLGITQVDPIKHGTDFERFMSKDRLKPPDVDMDIEDARRGEALAWLAKRFESSQIGTWSKLGSTVDPETGEEKGSVLQTWFQSKRRMCENQAWDKEKHLAEKQDRKPVKYQAVDAGKKRFAREFGWVKSMEDVRKVNKSEYEGLRRLAEMNSAFRSYGVHAAGVLLSGEHIKITDYIPRMLVASSDTTVTQYDMDDVEEFGILKMDLLGQTTLSVMRRCQELIGLDDPTDFSWIPMDDRAAYRLLRTGRTNTGIFHFEGYTKAKGGRELKVTNLKDTVLVQALYMPGCMDVAPGQKTSQKDLYLQRRNSASERKKVTYLHGAFEKALKETHGAVVFQEQVINIMRGLGMDIAGINTFFKVVKDSGKGSGERNRERMAKVRKQFDSLCHQEGIDSDAAWGQTAAFVAYGFNRAHATGYAIRTYRCAYLKAHYPLEFMTALLESWAGRDKEALYIKEARRMEIPILPPHVNISGAAWTMDASRGAIRRGLLSIKGVGPAIADTIARNAPYDSVKDLCERTKGVGGTKKFLDNDSYTGALAALQSAGALKRLKEN